MTTPERQIARELGGIYLAFSVVVGGWYMASGLELGSIPQWLTAIFAVIAGGIAWYSIQSQREIARKRAAIDFFLKTELDSNLLSAYSDFYDATEVLNKAGSIAEFAATKEYKKLCEYLGVHELMALGVLNGVFDEDICRAFWSDVLQSACTYAFPVIAYVRTEDGYETTYSDMLRLNEKWNGPIVFKPSAPTLPLGPAPSAPILPHSPSPPS